MNFPIFTVGHSNHETGDFLRLLKKNDVNAIIDVRSSPFSEYSSDYNRNNLKTLLKDNDIEYYFLGIGLGGRRSSRKFYTRNKPGGKERVCYKLIAEEDDFKEALTKVAKVCKRYRLALMCSEKDPLVCHRTLLVAKELDNCGHELYHILGDGRQLPHHEAMDKLVIEEKFDKKPLSRDQKIEYAIDSRASKKAHMWPDDKQPSDTGDQNEDLLDRFH